METGKPATECDWVSYVDYKAFSDDFKLGAYIRNQMSESRVVVLCGYPYQGVSFSAENFKRTFNIQEEQKFFVLGKFLIFFKCNWLIILSDMEKCMKNLTYPHINMSFKDFCDGTMDSSKIQCILDCPSNDGEKPSIIKYVFFKN